jgi:hypothetical protein
LWPEVTGYPVDISDSVSSANYKSRNRVTQKVCKTNEISVVGHAFVKFHNMFPTKLKVLIWYYDIEEVCFL